MKRFLASFVLVAAAGSAVVVFPASALAQDAAASGPLVGVGFGASRVAEPDSRAARFGPSLNLRAGWRVNPSIALMLEWNMNGVGSPNADSIIDPEINGGSYSNRQLSTGALLASVQFGTPAFYVRPGLGISRQAFTVYEPLPADGYRKTIGHEAGPAAAFAVGHEFGLSGFPIAVEASAIWTGGEDSSGGRWSAGLQLSKVVQF